MACGDPTTRRAILRALTTLPLVGGAVSLIGVPSAVAEPVTPRLLAGYADWLLAERRILLHEIVPDPDHRAAMRYQYFGNSEVERFHCPGFPTSWRDMPQPSGRAALVLSTVGCDWRQ